jgi:hypothetical protein
MSSVPSVAQKDLKRKATYRGASESRVRFAQNVLASRLKALESDSFRCVISKFTSFCFSFCLEFGTSSTEFIKCTGW